MGLLKNESEIKPVTSLNLLFLALLFAEVLVSFHRDMISGPKLLL